MITTNLHPREDAQPKGRVLAANVAQLALLDGANILGDADDPAFQAYLWDLAREAKSLALDLGIRQLEAGRLCPVAGCNGDRRYAAPGRGHRADCEYGGPE